MFADQTHTIKPATSRNDTHTAKPMPPDVDTVFASLGEKILNWSAMKYGGEVTQADHVTAEFNTSQIPDRFAQLMGPHVDAMDSMNHPSILDVGCGFGGISLYLAARYPDAHITATDVSDWFYSIAVETVIECKLRNISFATKSILDLNDVDNYDVVLLCNMLCYMTSYDDLQRGCQNAFQAMKPGGYLALHTPHYWSQREPFTGLPGLQFLPMPMRNLIARKTGKRSEMSDIRLPSLRELRYIFSDLGARDILYQPSRLRRRFNSTHVTMWVRK